MPSGVRWASTLVAALWIGTVFVVIRPWLVERTDWSFWGLAVTCLALAAAPLPLAFLPQIRARTLAQRQRQIRDAEIERIEAHPAFVAQSMLYDGHQPVAEAYKAYRMAAARMRELAAFASDRGIKMVAADGPYAPPEEERSWDTLEATAAEAPPVEGIEMRRGERTRALNETQLRKAIAAKKIKSGDRFRLGGGAWVGLREFAKELRSARERAAAKNSIIGFGDDDWPAIAVAEPPTLWPLATIYAVAVAAAAFVLAPSAATTQVAGTTDQEPVATATAASQPSVAMSPVIERSKRSSLASTNPDSLAPADATAPEERSQPRSAEPSSTRRTARPIASARTQWPPSPFGTLPAGVAVFVQDGQTIVRVSADDPSEAAVTASGLGDPSSPSVARLDGHLWLPVAEMPTDENLRLDLHPETGDLFAVCGESRGRPSFLRYDGSGTERLRFRGTLGVIPVGLAVGYDGSLYITPHHLQRFGEPGIGGMLRLPSRGEVELLEPHPVYAYDLQARPNGDLYYTDHFHFKGVRCLRAGGSDEEVVRVRSDRGMYLALAEGDSFYLTESAGPEGIQFVGPDREPSLVVETPGFQVFDVDLTRDRTRLVWTVRDADRNWFLQSAPIVTGVVDLHRPLRSKSPLIAVGTLSDTIDRTVALAPGH